MSGISGLSFDSPFLSPLLFFCLVLLLFPRCQFLLVVHSPFYLENSQTFFVKELGFCMALAEQLGDDKLVGGMCSLLPYGTGICHCALICLVCLFVSVRSLKKSFVFNMVLIN